MEEIGSTSPSVLVTGATGMVGSWLVRYLLDSGTHVVALVRDSDPQSEFVRSGDAMRTEVINGHLESYEDVERAIVEHEVGTVFHLGAQTIVGTALRAPLATFEANVRGSYNLLEACRRHRDLVGSIVVASSDKAYGDPTSLPYTEDMPPLGRHPYDVSKSCTDLLATSYAETYGLNVAVARCGNVYGGGDLHWDRIVPGTIRSLLKGQSPEVRSDGTYTRDYTYVDDVVRAYVVLSEKTHSEDVRGEAFNFSFGQPVSVLDLVARIAGVVKRTDLQPVVLNTAHGEIAHQYLDSSKAHRVLGWKPTVGLDEGLKKTVDWYLEYLNV